MLYLMHCPLGVHVMLSRGSFAMYERLCTITHTLDNSSKENKKPKANIKPHKRSCRENVTEKREKCKLYINCICEISLFIGLSMVEHLSVIAEVEHSSVR